MIEYILPIVGFISVLAYVHFRFDKYDYSVYIFKYKFHLLNKGYNYFTFKCIELNIDTGSERHYEVKMTYVPDDRSEAEMFEVLKLKLIDQLRLENTPELYNSLA